MTVFGQRVAQLVANHDILVFFIVRRGRKIIINFLKRLGSVIIVRIDDGKGAVDKLAGGQHGVGGTPRLFAAGRRRKACRQIVYLLKGIFYLHLFFNAAADHLFKLLLDLVLNNKNNLFKACAAGVKQ